MEPYQSNGRQYGRGMNVGNMRRPGMNPNGMAPNRGNQFRNTANSNGMNKASDNCNCGSGCKEENPNMKHMPLAMGFVAMQDWGELYDPSTALCQGTAFPDLNLIFCGARGK